MDSAETSFKRVLTLLDHDWVHDFIFPPSPPIEQLHYALLSAATSPYASTVSLQLSTVTPPTGPGCESLDEQVTMFFVPSFATSQISACFQIVQCHKSAKSHKGSELCCMRMVRDGCHGFYLSVSEPIPGYTEVSYGVTLRPGLRESAFMVFRTEAFRMAVAGLHRGYDGQAMRNALKYCYYSVEQRACPICGTRDSRICKCMLPISRKRHPLDHETDNRNLVSVCGEYDGLASIGRYASGSTEFFTQCASKSTISFIHDPTVQNRLSQWAMETNLCETPINLLRLNVSEHHEGVLGLRGLAAKERQSDIACRPSAEYLETGVGDGSPLCEQTEQSFPCTSDDLGQEGFDPIAIYLQSDEVGNEEMHAPRHLSHLCGNTYLRALPSPETFCQAPLFKQTETARCPAVNCNCCSQQPSGGVHGFRSIGIPNSGCRPGRTGRGPVKLKEATTLSRLAPAGLRISPPQARQTTVFTTLTREQKWQSCANFHDHGNAQCVADEKKRRLEARKIRNRAAAHHSNYIKKLRREKMKMDLATLAQKEEQLRKRETELREENMCLKRALQ